MLDWHIRKELKIMKKEFTAWDTFIIGLNMFVLGMWLVHITNGSSDGVGTSRYVSELVVVLFKISEWFMVVWMIGLFGMATYTYMKNRKAGMTVIQSFKKMTLLYLLLEIPMGICYYWAINLRM